MGEAKGGGETARKDEAAGEREAMRENNQRKRGK